MSIADAAGFLARREQSYNLQAAARSAQDPRTRLVAAVREYALMPLADVPKVIGLSPEAALLVVNQLIDEGSAVLLERQDRPGVMYLKLTDPAARSGRVG